MYCLRFTSIHQAVCVMDMRKAVISITEFGRQLENEAVAYVTIAVTIRKAGDVIDVEADFFDVQTRIRQTQMFVKVSCIQ